MGKACIFFGSLAISLFVGYAAVAANTESSTWYLNALWIGFVATGILFILTGLAYLLLIVRKHLNSLEILNDWRCTYWPSEKQLKVTLWFHDHSGASTFSTECAAQFDQLVVKINDNVTIGGTYMSKTGLKSGQNKPTMIEFFKPNVELNNVNLATVTVRIKPSYGVWTAKKKSKVVSVQVINR